MAITQISNNVILDGTILPAKLNVSANMRTFLGNETISTINGGTGANDDLTLQGTTNATRTTSYVLIQPNGGNVGIGTQSPVSQLNVVTNSTTSTRGLTVGQHTTDAAGAFGIFQKSRGNNTSPTSVSNGDYLGLCYFQGHDGSAYRSVGSFGYRVTGSVTSNNIPGQLFFSSSSSDDTNPVSNNTIRIVINSDGGVGMGTLTPSTKAVLDLTSTTKGFLPPRMTETERNAITSVPAALLVYNTTANSISLYNGTAWGEVLTTHAASFTSDTLRNAVSDETGTGNLVFSTNPTFQDANVTGNLAVTAHFSAATKSFKIPHQTKGGYLQYGVVESNEHSVYVRGSTSDSVIHLPDHWLWLVDAYSVTVTLTPVGKFQPLFVESSDNEKVIVGGVEGRYNYVVYGTRKDVEPLQIEIE